MKRQAGFSLVEMLAAIFVLSLGAVAVSEAISRLLSGWTKTDLMLSEAMTKARAVEETSIVQGQMKAETEEPLYLFSDKQAMIIAAPRVDHDASCRFDLVARQCR